MVQAGFLDSLGRLPYLTSLALAFFRASVRVGRKAAALVLYTIPL